MAGKAQRVRVGRGLYVRGPSWEACATVPGRRASAWKVLGKRSEITEDEAQRLRDEFLDDVQREYGPPRARARGRIYVIQRGSDGPVKIGYTRGAARVRASNLQIGSADPLHVRRVWQAPPSYERFMHNFFADRRLNGEWFDVTPEEVIEAVVLLYRFLRTSTVQVGP